MALQNANTGALTVGRVHHSAIVVRDFDASLRFWRDGIGFEAMMDMQFDGDWGTLFHAPSQRLRSVFLGDPARADAGIVELVQFLTDGESGPGRGEPADGPAGDVSMATVVDPDGVLVELIGIPSP
jgi:catechol 2,3-dioxygenase-like lactoylglutathione lyase family enzyme